MNTLLRFLLIAFCVPAFISCKHPSHTKVERAFYYWKSNGHQLQDNEETYLRKLHVQKLYVKFFEVGYDNTFGIIPTSKTDFYYYNYWNDSDIVLQQMHIIPTIYIKNEIFFKSSKAGLDSLADNILFLTNKYYKNLIRSSYEERMNKEKAAYDELQIDCDWTATTRENYFYLLKSLKRQSNKIISCTLRLYPYKYQTKMGMPPVDKATLMCYNLINPLKNENKNSILDLNEFKTYLNVGKKYPLHLDIALPVYSWMQCYQNNHFTGMIYHDNASILKVLEPVDELWYQVTKDTVIDDLYLRVGDKIKYEAITPEKLNKAIALIKDNVQLDNTSTIAFFHLDGTNLKQISYETLDSLYTDFSK